MLRDSLAKPIVFAGPHHGIAVSGADDLAAFLFELIPEWPLLADGGGAAGLADGVITVNGAPDHWRVSSPHVALSEFELDDGYMVANTLIGALIAAYVAQNENLASIHAGAVRIGGGLVVLLGENGSGKSTFTTALAARGHRFFTDDRLVLDLAPDTPRGRSMSIAPKLRLPLPAEADRAYREFVTAQSLLTWPRLAVLRLAPELAAGFGETLPIKALIHLRRDESAREPVLSPLRRPAMVRILLDQLFAPHLSQQGELAACVRLAGSVGLWQLHYASVFKAMDHVIARLGGGRQW